MGISDILRRGQYFTLGRPQSSVLEEFRENHKGALHYHLTRAMGSSSPCFATNPIGRSESAARSQRSRDRHYEAASVVQHVTDANELLLCANGSEHFLLRRESLAGTSTAVTVIISGDFVCVATVAIDPTVVCKRHHGNRDVTQHQQYCAGDENRNEDRTSMHKPPTKNWFST